jgi:hypothetical protein
MALGVALLLWNISHFIDKDKGKVIPLYTMEVHGVRGGIAPTLLTWALDGGEYFIDGPHNTV